MKKSTVLLIALSLVTIVCLYVSGCGQSSSTTTTTTPSAATFTLSGKLATGTLAQGAAALRTQASAHALSSYNVTAVSKSTGNIYFAAAATDSGGNFSIEKLPAGDSYYLEILDSSNKLIAPITMGTIEGKAIMTLTPEGQSSVSLGQINYDSASGGAAPITAPSSYLDESSSVEVKSGTSLVPKGAGNYGKGSGTEIVSSTYNPNVADGDKDGLPNILDADNNGDLIADEFDGLYTNEVFSITTIPNIYTYAFTNLKIDYNDRSTFTTNYANFTIALGVTPNSKTGFTPKTISSCKVTAGPAWISKAYVATNTPRTLWSTSSYDIPKKSGSDVYEVQLGGDSATSPTSTLKPGTDVTAGDTLKIKVTYTDGTSEEAIKMINFAFTDIPKVVAYKFGSSSASWQTPPTTGNNFGTFSSSEVWLRWTRPKDESGAEITKGRYTFEYNKTGGGATEIEVVNKDTSSATSVEGTCNFSTLTDADLTGDPLLIGVCIRSIASDNAAENIWFTRGW